MGSIKVYNPFFNVSVNELKLLAQNYDIPYFEYNNNNDKYNFLNNSIMNLNNYYPEWAENIYDINKTKNEFTELMNLNTSNFFSTKKFKNGFKINFNTNQIPYGYWKKNMMKYINEYKFDIDIDNLLEIYLYSESNDQLEKVNNDIYIYYCNKHIIFYNNSNIQKYLNSGTLIFDDLNADKIELNNNNVNLHNLILNNEITIEKLLDEKINFYISDTYNYIPSNIKINNLILKELYFKDFNLENDKIILVKI